MAGVTFDVWHGVCVSAYFTNVFLFQGKLSEKFWYVLVVVVLFVGGLTCLACSEVQFDLSGWF